MPSRSHSSRPPQHRYPRQRIQQTELFAPSAELPHRLRNLLRLPCCCSRILPRYSRSQRQIKINRLVTRSSVQSRLSVLAAKAANSVRRYSSILRNRDRPSACTVRRCRKSLSRERVGRRNRHARQNYSRLDHPCNTPPATRYRSPSPPNRGRIWLVALGCGEVPPPPQPHQ